MASGIPGTCKIHGLATRPDGTCVRCREEQQQTGAKKVIIGVTAAFALCVVGLGAFWVLHEPDTGERIVAPSLELPEVPASSANVLKKANNASPAVAPPGNTENPWAGLEEQDTDPAPVDSASHEDEEEDEEKERERKIEAAMKNVSVTVYYTPTCPNCQKALAWLRYKKIPHVTRDVEASESARRKWEFISSSRSVPKFDIDGKVIDGFSQSSVQDAIREVAEKRVDQGRY